jgi:hypothetical protein
MERAEQSDSGYILGNVARPIFKMINSTTTAITTPKAISMRPPSLAPPNTGVQVNSALGGGSSWTARGTPTFQP